MENVDVLELQDEFVQDFQEQKSKSLEELKIILEEKGKALKALLEEELRLTRQLKTIDSSIFNLKEEIRKEWLPYTVGTDKAELAMDGVCLIMEEVLSLKAEDKDAAVKWCLDNGFEGVMKWQIHDQTLKKIARDKFESDILIPGVEYNKVKIVKIKK